ncbi:histone-lysine N-methyltransferase, H3 lysine-9 specific SUVH5 [Amborella trichopoda]|uniref:SET domain-containing protein n=1 Tax=Amborella trichopoda TaxID=13333 RepID=W1NJE9_AMBTC|nr:histone-lysine N-methyltransferase, H3 lysine-9 specific SUVH5 [Amborella trichopoda]ERM95290.1 hypothetical protein AMTR_s00008p00104700 [Amborella trichopoda]|eukprot:XP_006827874.1 histone-lysine N-methyltransferase, H3 lysine-9 specific SUVH5 [Amborella trichopoda]
MATTVVRKQVLIEQQEKSHLRGQIERRRVKTSGTTNMHRECMEESVPDRVKRAKLRVNRACASNSVLESQSRSKVSNKRTILLSEQSPVKKQRVLSERNEKKQRVLSERNEGSKYQGRLLHGSGKMAHRHGSCDIYSRLEPIPWGIDEGETDLGLPQMAIKPRISLSERIPTREEVRKTLRLYQWAYRKFSQDTEGNIFRGERNPPNRPELWAMEFLREKNKFVNTGDPILGKVPGIEVGDEFQFRAELIVVGLHRQRQAGIDCMRKNGTLLATSVVISGGYADNDDQGDVIIYSGHGGNASYVVKGKPKDQKLERGNLALLNSKMFKTPVRVIRGFKKSKKCPLALGIQGFVNGRKPLMYTYDGLYQVESHFIKRGSHGCNVFQFILRRQPNQPELVLNPFKQVDKFRRLAGLERVIVRDVSKRMDTKPICVVNNINSDAPSQFEYIKKMIYPKIYSPSPHEGCSCIGRCSEIANCSCAIKNGKEFPYSNGCLVESKPLVYECGPSCTCRPSCGNRVSQGGIKFELQVFKTKLKGWGVRPLGSIPSASFICEYLGEILTRKMVEKRVGPNEYFFDIGVNFTDKSFKDTLSFLVPESEPTEACDTVEIKGFTIDASINGNVARFINHSCSPNLYAQSVLYDHGDKAVPHIMLFARENIRPFEELTIYYKFASNHVCDNNSNGKKKECHCGSSECTG